MVIRCSFFTFLKYLMHCEVLWVKNSSFDINSVSHLGQTVAAFNEASFSILDLDRSKPLDYKMIKKTLKS
jgi:hypothetical protein